MGLTDDAIAKVKEMIISGRLRPGERLPREVELAAQLGLSRNSLREAVRALALVNVLDVRQGDGTFVTSLSPGLLMEAVSFVVDVQHDGAVLEFLEVRRLLEPAATALATHRMSQDDVDGLGLLLQELGESPTVEALVANDQEFHRRIARAAGNDVLLSLIASISGRTHRARVWRGLTQESAVARTIEEHRLIHAAIAARRADVAEAWANVHIAGVEQWLRRAVAPDVDTGPASVDLSESRQ